MALGCAAGLAAATASIAASAAAALAYSSCKLQGIITQLKEDIVTLRGELQNQHAADAPAARTHAPAARTDAGETATTAAAAPTSATATTAAASGTVDTRIGTDLLETVDALDTLGLPISFTWPELSQDKYVDGEPVMEVLGSKCEPADVSFPALSRVRDTLNETFHAVALAHCEAEMLAARAKLASPRDVSLPGLSSSSTTFVCTPEVQRLSPEEEIHLLRSQLHQAVSRRELASLRRALDHALAYGINPNVLAIELAYYEELCKQQDCRSPEYQVSEALQSRQYQNAVELIVDSALTSGFDTDAMKKALVVQFKRLMKAPCRHSSAPPVTRSWECPVRLSPRPSPRPDTSLATPRSARSYTSATPRSKHFMPPPEDDVLSPSPSASPLSTSRGIPPPPSQHVPPPAAPASGDIEETLGFSEVSREHQLAMEVTRELHYLHSASGSRSPKITRKRWNILEQSIASLELLETSRTESSEGSPTPRDKIHPDAYAGAAKLQASAPHAAMFEVKNLRGDDDDEFRLVPNLRRSMQTIAMQRQALMEPFNTGLSSPPLAKVPPRSPKLELRNCPGRRVEWS